MKKISAMLAAGALAAGLSWGAVAAATPTGVPVAVPQAATEVKPTATLTKATTAPSKGTRAVYAVKVRKVKGASIKSVTAWVGDRADGGVKAKVAKRSATKKHLRWKITVPMTETDVAKRGLTLSYRVVYKDGSEEWRDVGVTLGVK